MGISGVIQRIKISPETKRKSFLTMDALTKYVQSESWQIRDIHEGIKEAEAGEFATDEQVKAVFSKYSAC